MDSLVTPLLAWIDLHPGWAYLLVFLTALAESVALVGMLVPGVVIMIGAGALIATGKLAFWPTVTLAIAGAIVGDSFSYWIGFRYRDQLRQHWPFNRHPAQLERGIAFFQRYGAKSVAFGRFVGPGRAIIPMVAGMMQMPRGRFAAANISSAIAWGPAYLAPGIVFGASLKLAAEATARLVVLLLVVLSLFWLSAWLARRIYLRLSPQASSWVRAWLRWANLHPTLGRIAQALAEPAHPDAAILASLALVLVTATAVLAASISAGLVGPEALTPNQIAFDLGQSLHTPLADQVMVALSRLAEPVVTLPLVVAILVYLSLSQQRPWSFPSGQVLSATVIYGFLAISVARPLKAGWRWLPYAVAAVIITAVAIARLYLGTEWLSDILGSIALGLAWIAALGLAFHQHTEAPSQVAGLVLVSLAALGCAFSAATAVEQSVDLARYRATPRTLTIDATHWHARQALPIASQREDLWHRHQRPFDIQYAGPLDALTRALIRQGWQPAEMLSWGNAIKLLSPSLPLAELPLVPHVHDGHHDDLRLVKDLPGNRRLVLRLWATPVLINATQPLWIGNLTELTKETIVDLFALPTSVPADAPSQQQLYADLSRLPSIKADIGAPTLITPEDSSLRQD